MEEMMVQLYLPNKLVFARCRNASQISYWLYGENSFNRIIPAEIDIYNFNDINLDDPSVLMDLQLKNEIKIIDNCAVKGIKIAGGSTLVTLIDPRLENSRIAIEYRSFIKFLQNADKVTIKNGEIISPVKYSADKKDNFYIMPSSKNKNFNYMNCVG